MKRHKLPDLEAVFNQGDYPVTPSPRNPEHMTYLYKNIRPPPVFSPTGSRTSYDIPWPDFRCPPMESRGPPLDSCDPPWTL
eukprot:8362868-Pyramimonas_sp.AAC.1